MGIFTCYLLLDLSASSENASDVGEEGAEEDDDDTESTVGSRLWKSSLGFKQSKPSYTTSRQLNKPECDHVKRIRRMTTTTDSHGYDPIHYSNHVITPVKKTRRKQFMSQFSTPFDKPDAFYSASLANLNPRSSQILVAYKKSICTTTNPYSKGLTSLHSSKPSLIYLTNEPMSILHTIGRVISGIMANIFHFDSVYLSGLSTFIGGLAHLLLVFILPRTFTWYAIYASVYGLCS
ncbi:unnamed protein product, partial [Trichobilharzia regenti]